MAEIKQVSATCRVCSAMFEFSHGRGRHRRFCGPECKQKGKQKRVSVATCKTCGGEFYPRYGSGGFCSLKCRPPAKPRIWATRTEMNRACRHRRRARLAEAPYEDFSAQEIFDRDGWKCGICGKQVDPSLPPRHPKAASLDHIQPIARGGGHVRANVQCSHSLCNAQKTHHGKGGQFKLPF